MAAAWRVAPLALAEVCVGLRTASQQQLYTEADNCTSVGPHSRAELGAWLGIRKPEQGPL